MSVISAKQHAANQRNAQLSTGPKTAEGKAHVAFNALTWSLRAQTLILPDEDPTDYQRLWNAFEADWQPQNQTERYYLELMCTSQWRLIRADESEKKIRGADLPLWKEMKLLDRVGAERVRLERSFTTALHELERLKEKREAAREKQQPPETAQPAKPSSAPAPGCPVEHNPGAPPLTPDPCAQTGPPVLCAPASTDSR